MDTSAAPPAVTAPTAGTTTRDTRPSVSGTAEPNGSVVVTLDGTALPATPVAADGTWVLRPGTALADGAHTLTAVQTDALGNVSAASAAVTFTTDTTALPPVVTSALIDTTGAGTVAGTAEPFAHVVVRTATGTLVGEADADAQGVWSLRGNGLTLLTILTAVQTDPAGNTSAPALGLHVSLGPVSTPTPDPPHATTTSTTTPTTRPPVPRRTHRHRHGRPDRSASPTTSGAVCGIPVLGGLLCPTDSPTTTASPTDATTGPSATATATDVPHRHGRPHRLGVADDQRCGVRDPGARWAAVPDGHPDRHPDRHPDDHAHHHPHGRPHRPGQHHGPDEHSDSTRPAPAVCATSWRGRPVPDGERDAHHVDPDGPADRDPDRHPDHRTDGHPHRHPTGTLCDLLGAPVCATSVPTTSVPTTSVPTTSVPTTSTPVVTPTVTVTVTPTGTPTVTTPTAPATPAAQGPSIVVPVDGYVTAQGHQLVRGRAAPGSTVIVKDGATVLGTVVADANGMWTIAPTTAFTTGTHALTATQVSADGKRATSAVNRLTVTAAAGVGPVITAPITGTVTPRTRPTFSGTAAPGSTVTLRTLDGRVVGTAVATASAADPTVGTWVVPSGIDLPTGDTTVVATKSWAGSPRPRTRPR